jgi:hypothetical protein
MNSPETMTRRAPFAKRLARFEQRLAAAKVRPKDRALLDEARGLARRGAIDLRALASRTRRSIKTIYHRRAWLDAHGLWPWETDKSYVGAPRCWSR